MSARHLSQQQFGIVLNGSPSYLGSIVTTSAAAKNNHDTAVPFNNTGAGLSGKVLLIQVSAACYFLGKITNSAAVTTATGVKLAADERVIVTLTKDEGWFSVIRDSADVTVKVFELR